MVVHRPDPHPGGHRLLADEASQELLRGQEAGVNALVLGTAEAGKLFMILNVCVCVCARFFVKWVK